MWESTGRLSARAKRSQKRYACTACHSSTVHPTHMNDKIWVPRKQANQINSNKGISNSITAPNNNINSPITTSVT